MGPLSHLQKILREGEENGEEYRLELLVLPTFAWETLCMGDMLFMQRPYNSDHVKIAKMAKDMGCPIWVDYDDDLFAVPTDNPAHAIYAGEDIQKNIATLAAMADEVSVSTNFLRERFLGLNKNVTVIPNALNEKLFFYRTNKDIMRRRIIFWRGSPSHQRDVASFSHQIIELSNKFQKWTWNFLGYNPWFATDYMREGSCVVAPALEIIDFHKFLHKTRPALTIVPLHNSGFNLSKSNIAWLETIFAGGLAIAPNWEEWKHPGCYHYESPDDFKRVTAELIERFEDPQERQKLANENADAWKYVLENFTLETVNEKRFEIIKRLASLEMLSIPEGV
jgi:hypothetical protein